MDKVYISKTVAFGTLPLSVLTDLRLSPPAFKLAFWLASRPDGWQPWRSHIMRELGMGVEMWQNARRQLESAGYLIRHGQHNQGGKFGGMRIEFNPMPGTVTGLPVHGSPVTGSAGHIEQRIKKQKTKEPPPPPVVATESLIFPNGIDEGLEQVLNQILQPILFVEKKQELLDELAGSIEKGTVKSPAGLLRKLVNLYDAGTLVCELAPLIKKKRVNPIRIDDPLPTIMTSGTSPTALRERQKLQQIKRAQIFK